VVVLNALRDLENITRDGVDGLPARSPSPTGSMPEAAPARASAPVLEQLQDGEPGHQHLDRDRR
jgi:hypothetical protein